MLPQKIKQRFQTFWTYHNYDMKTYSLIVVGVYSLYVYVDCTETEVTIWLVAAVPNYLK